MKGQLTCKAENPTATCEPFVQEMWEPQDLNHMGTLGLSQRYRCLFSLSDFRCSLHVGYHYTLEVPNIVGQDSGVTEHSSNACKRHISVFNRRWVLLLMVLLVFRLSESSAPLFGF